MNETNGIKKGEPFAPAKLASFAEGSIVSRELLETENGGITLFAFAKGQRLSEHSAPFDAVVQILEGEAEITIEGRPNRLEKGQMIVMPANKPHAVKATEGFKMLLTMIKA